MLYRFFRSEFWFMRIMWILGAGILLHQIIQNGGCR